MSPSFYSVYDFTNIVAEFISRFVPEIACSWNFIKHVFPKNNVKFCCCCFNLENSPRNWVSDEGLSGQISQVNVYGQALNPRRSDTPWEGRYTLILFFFLFFLNEFTEMITLKLDQQENLWGKINTRKIRIQRLFFNFVQFILL